MKTIALFLASLVGVSQAQRFRQQRTLRITVTNVAYRQPLSQFFVSVHDETSVPLFQMGTEATSALATLAEQGDPSELDTFYNGEASQGILSAVVAGDAPTGPGGSISFDVTVNRDYPYISFAAMAVNTNDCFIGISGMELWGGETISSPGYDSGSEENNEDCASVPGPACGGLERSGNGEGFVHIHRGVHGIADLTQSVYDWRNPMARITVERIA